MLIIAFLFLAGCYYDPKPIPQYKVGDFVQFYKEDYRPNCISKGTIGYIRVSKPLPLMDYRVRYTVHTAKFQILQIPACIRDVHITEDQIWHHKPYVKPQPVVEPKKYKKPRRLTPSLNKCAEDYYHCMTLLKQDARVNDSNIDFYEQKCENELEMCVLRNE